MLSSRMLNATVTVTTKEWGNVRGVRTSTTSSVSHPASVQPMRADRKAAHGMSEAETGYTVYFATDPGVKVDDSIIWNGKTLAVLGPGRDEAGRGRVWAVDCKHRT